MTGGGAWTRGAARTLSQDRGAAGVEVAGITMVVATLVAAAMTALAAASPDVLGRPLSASICRAWDRLPGVDMGCADLPVTAMPEEVPYEEREWTYEQVTSGPMVFVGDSYGSGEGAGDYDPDTDYGPSWWQFWEDSGENRCHRSGNAWGVGVGEAHWSGDYSFVACSGATTNEVTNPNGGNDGEGPQGEAVDEDTSMIFLSMGGNDAQFSHFLTECLAANFANGQIRSGGGYVPESALVYCSDWFSSPDPDDAQGRTRMDVILDQVEENLADMYEHLLEQSGGNAHMVQMGYPQLFDPDYLGLVDPKDVAFLNSMADELNARMARVARENGVHFIDPTAAFQGHGVGSDDPWILGLGFWSEHQALPPESFHPNAQGQAAMQELIEEYLGSMP